MLVLMLMIEQYRPTPKAFARAVAKRRRNVQPRKKASPHAVNAQCRIQNERLQLSDDLGCQPGRRSEKSTS